MVLTICGAVKLQLNLLQAAFLGLLQGLSEFLPISSSGHLILGAAVLGLPAPGLSFSIMVHLGTALATVVMLWGEVTWLVRGVFLPKDRSHRGRALGIGGLILVASIPAALVALLAKDIVERAFSSAIVASAGLIFTGFALYLTKGRGGRGSSTRPEMLGTVGLGRALTIGVAQALAITPGVSRSGMTMATGLLTGASREDSARFSFLMAIPAVLGGAFLDYRAAVQAGVSMISPEGLTGAAVAFVAGMFALAVVFRVVRKGELSKFAYYCWAVGLPSLIWFLTRR